MAEEKEIIIENLNDEEISRLFKSDTSIDWGIDDMDRRDIVVYSDKDAKEILLIIGRISWKRDSFFFINE